MLNNILGGIIGGCVADALGVPVEFADRESLRKDLVTDMRSFGTWSDDTSMTLCFLDSLSNGLDYEDLMKKFHHWFKDGAYTPYGEAFDIGIVADTDRGTGTLSR